MFLGQLLVVHAGLPVELSRHGPRHGWRNGGPGSANLSGLVPLIGGTALVSWAVAEHSAASTDKRLAISRALEPEYLVTGGPYRFSRNPMYVGGVAIWGGWTVLFGSAPVAAGLVVLTAIYRVGIAWEERMLERRWGDAWLDYAERSSRWLSLKV